jgi:hypothetical protein
MSDLLPTWRDPEYAGYLVSMRGDLICDYLRRGRQLSAWNDTDLSATWLRVLHLRADTPDDPDWIFAYDDLLSEFDLRGLSPPWHAASDDLERIHMHASAKLEKLRSDDPEEYDRFTDAVRDGIAVYRDTLRS